MPDAPNIEARTNDFEFAALEEARNYRRALFQEFETALKGDVLEVGSGIGQMTNHLVQLPAVKRTTCVEPDAAYCARHQALFPEREIICGTVQDLPRGNARDAILCVNVLEHIRDDEGELQRYSEILRPRRGWLCLFVPAGPEIYAPIDKDFGHFRRYRRMELRIKLMNAGFEIGRLNYFNFVGYIAWWANFCLLKKRHFERAKVRFYDRVIFPSVHVLESRFIRPPFGQSLIALAQATAV